MKSYIFSNKVRPIGWVLFISCFCIGLVQMIYDFSFFVIESPVFAFVSTPLFGGNEFMFVIQNNITDEVISIGLIVGLVFLTFSREKVEDEFIRQVRLDALIWAVFVNQILILISVLFLFDFVFLNVMVFNLFSTLILFVLRYEYKKFSLKKELKND